MTRFIALVSGKGGVGKTTATLNIGHALAQMGKKVLLVDANLVTPNLALHLGLINPEATLNQFLRKEKHLSDITYHFDFGLSLIPASPSYVEYQKTNPQKLGEIFEHLENLADYVLIDAPSGLGYEVGQVLKHSDEAIIVVHPNLSSVIDALKTIQLAKAQNNIISGVLLNMSHRGRNELKAKEVERILGYPLLAEIKADRKFRKALNQEAPLHYLYPHSRSARQFRKVAEFLSLNQDPEKA